MTAATGRPGCAAAALPTAAGRSAQQLAGTAALLRLALRRDRLMMPLWALLLGGSFASVARSFTSLYNTSADRAGLARSMNANSSLRALYGPVFSDSAGGLTAWRMAGLGAVLAAVMSLVVVVRHTREEEETGRQELLSSAGVGRRAPLTAALLAAMAANAALACVTAAGLTASGEPAGGSVALALAVAGAGMLFACTAALAAQLTESARAAKGIGGAAIGAAYVLKAAGDAVSGGGSSGLTWLSPVGWAENVRPYASERWWVLLLMAAAVAAQAALAYTLAGRRDLGMSFLPARPGPAGGRMGTAGALARRLQRGGVAGWIAGFLVTGVVFGGITGGAGDLVGGNAGAREIFERMGGHSGLTTAFLAAMTGVLGTVAALYVVASVLRLHAEETGGRAESLLAGGVGRLRWAAGHLTVAFVGSAAVVLAGGAGLALGYGHEPGAVIGAALAQLPAVWVLGGVAVLLYGAAPKVAPAAWAVAGLALALGWIGPALRLPQPVLGLSPFGHLAKLPGAEMAWTPVVVLLLITAALVTAGLMALRRRDMTG
ncbi:ABC transporter permease [Streptomyces sp. NBC_00859]|uniref:ABC transporter permease n=1 Tax=Streptomyces sp. NBC_00859 TaxID=2903682 RepID=UPI003865F70E|nr:ABC transporter permease [Streptomyces sp. NBC_00859]